MNDECYLYCCLLKCDSLPAKHDETVYFGSPIERLYDSSPVMYDSSAAKCDSLPVVCDATAVKHNETVYLGHPFERLHHSSAVKLDAS